MVKHTAEPSKNPTTVPELEAGLKKLSIRKPGPRCVRNAQVKQCRCIKEPSKSPGIYRIIKLCSACKRGVNRLNVPLHILPIGAGWSAKGDVAQKATAGARTDHVATRRWTVPSAKHTVEVSKMGTVVSELEVV